MRMRDDKGVDDKIVAVSVRDPSFEGYTDKSQLPAHVLRQVQRFFQDYKVLEHKDVVIEDMLGPDDALRIIRESLELYRQLRRGELKEITGAGSTPAVEGYVCRQSRESLPVCGSTIRPNTPPRSIPRYSTIPESSASPAMERRVTRSISGRRIP